MGRHHWLLLPLLLMFTAGLVYAVLSLPEHADGLQRIVGNKMEISGVSNPVTAVLLNFRGYDTLLEMVVLLLALLGVWSLGGNRLLRETVPGSVLDTLVRFLVPMLVLVAAYLLWIGAHAPGGAFQAGSLLGAAGVLLLLTGRRLRPALTALPLRLTLIAGCGAFITIAALTLLVEGQLLAYPPAQAGVLILFLETLAMLSIGATLAALFLGERPQEKEHK